MLLRTLQKRKRKFVSSDFGPRESHNWINRNIHSKNEKRFMRSCFDPLPDITYDLNSVQPGLAFRFFLN